MSEVLVGIGVGIVAILLVTVGGMFYWWYKAIRDGEAV